MTATGKIRECRVHDLMNEGPQILAMMIASAKSARISTRASIVNRKS
jgi:hypothetical protein